MSEYKCPLCGQPVSPTLYRKITGIWEESQKLKKKVKEERAKLKRKMAEEKKKLKSEREKFKKQKSRLIKRAADKQAKRFERRIKTLRKRERRIEKRARDRIKKAIAGAHVDANRRLKTLEKKLKKKLQDSVRTRLKHERERTKRRVEQRYEQLQKTFKTTLRSMGVKNKEIKKQQREIEELKKQLDRRTTPQIEGLLSENVLTKELKKQFKGDKIRHTGKGGDVIQTVVYNKEGVGVIVYECKRVKQHQTSHVKQAAKAKRTRNAYFAVLVTTASKRGTHGFFVERGVVVVHPSGVLALAGILRDQIVEIARMKLGRTQKDRAIKLILEYLEGPKFTNSMDIVIREGIGLQRELIDEIKKHEAAWKKRHEAHMKIRDEAFAVKETSKSLLSGKAEEKLPEPPEIPELPTPELSVRVKKKKTKVATES